jgi:hypothetical protein
MLALFLELTIRLLGTLLIYKCYISIKYSHFGMVQCCKCTLSLFALLVAFIAIAT